MNFYDIQMEDYYKIGNYQVYDPMQRELKSYLDYDLLNDEAYNQLDEWSRMLCEAQENVEYVDKVGWNIKNVLSHIVEKIAELQYDDNPESKQLMMIYYGFYRGALISYYNTDKHY